MVFFVLLGSGLKRGLVVERMWLGKQLEMGVHFLHLMVLHLMKASMIIIM